MMVSGIDEEELRVQIRDQKERLKLLISLESNVIVDQVRGWKIVRVATKVRERRL